MPSVVVTARQPRQKCFRLKCGDTRGERFVVAILRKRGKSTPGRSPRDAHGSHLVDAFPRIRTRERPSREPEGGCGLRPARILRSVGVLVRRVSLQKSISGVWPQISPRNAPQKRWQARVHGGLARSCPRISGGVFARRSVGSRVVAVIRCGIGRGLAWCDKRHAAVGTSLARRCAGRVPSAVTATGPHEGFLSMEDTSGRPSRAPSRGRGGIGLGALAGTRRRARRCA